MKLTPYKKILAMTKEKINESLAPIRASQAKSQAELAISKLEEEKITIEADIQEFCTKHPIDFEAIINKLDLFGLVERKQKQFTKIISELFPE